MTASRDRFSNTGEALMDALRKQRVSHRTLVTVEAYLIRIMKEYRVTELAHLRKVEAAARAVCTDWAGDPDFGPALDRLVNAMNADNPDGWNVMGREP